MTRSAATLILLFLSGCVTAGASFASSLNGTAAIRSQGRALSRVFSPTSSALISDGSAMSGVTPWFWVLSPVTR